MVVKGDDRRALENRRLAKDLARVHQRSAEASGRDELQLLQAVSGVEDQDPERLEGPVPEAREEEPRGIAGQAELRTRREGRRDGPPSELEGSENLRDARVLQAGNATEGRGARARKTFETAGALEDLVRELEHRPGSRSGAEKDRDQLVDPEAFDSESEEFLARAIGGGQELDAREGVPRLFYLNARLAPRSARTPRSSLGEDGRIPAAFGRFLPAGLAPLAEAADAFEAASYGERRLSRAFAALALEGSSSSARR
jgi:hypothetical protein